MKCCRCSTINEFPNSESFGYVFVPLKTTEYLGTDAKHFTYTGINVSWFVCDACAEKGADWSGIKFFAFMFTAVTTVIVINPSVLDELWFRILFAALTIFGLVSSSYFTWEKDKQSKYCRDEILRRSIETLRKRSDFIQSYGLIEPSSEAMTRFSRDEL